MPDDILASSTGVTHPLVLLQSAIERGLDPEKLGKLMDLAERWERNKAAQEFALAISGFQEECPTVFKNRTATVPGKFEYHYAGYDDVMRAAHPLLAKHKIALTFTSDVVSVAPLPQAERQGRATGEGTNAGIKITCRVRVGTHFEDHTLTLPIPAGVVNDTQRYGMALSYAKRYCMCAALNIVCTDDEDDDAASMVEFVEPAQIAQLKRLIDEKGVDLGRFLAWANVDGLDKICKKEYAKCIDMLQRKKAGQPAAKA
jgi:hypothetical protein